MRRSTNTAAGARSGITGRCGSRARCRSAGSPIATGIGAGSSPGAGTGSMSSPGDSRRSITAAGLMSTGCGAGPQAVAGALTGWFPLGPGEPYWPWYSNDSRYIAALNTGIVGDPRNLGARPSGDPASANLNFANRRFATVVPQQTFVAAQPIGRAALPIADPKAQHARVTAQAPPAPAGAAG